MAWAGDLEEALLSGTKPKLVSFIGNGGKTSLLKAMALAARNNGKSVLATTTTRVRVSEFSSPPISPLHLDDATPDVLSGLRRWGRIPFIHCGKDERKFCGIPPDRALTLGKGFGAVLVEADGGRGLPLKRLRDHEPPLPPGGSAVLVVGADAAGKTLEQACFNWEGAVAQGLADPGQKLDATDIRRILYGPRGYLDAVGNRPLFLAVNKGDLNTEAEALARELYHPRIFGVFVTQVKKGRIGSVRLTNRGKRISAVVLAAGESTRFGPPKQTAPLGRTTILGRVITNILGARGLEKIVVVLGHRHRKVIASLGNIAQDPRIRIVVNEDYLLGMSTSMRAGIRLAGPCAAAAVFLGDQPYIGPATINAVLDAYLSRPCRLAYPVAGGQRGHPVVLGRELFSQVESIEGDIGARAVVEKNAEWAAEVVLAPGTQRDIDHRKDLKRPGDGRAR
jgi:molybdenum cofactor cytidylyltransferase